MRNHRQIKHSQRTCGHGSFSSLIPRRKFGLIGKIFALLLVFFVTLGLSVSLQGIFAGWTPPSNPPPAGGIANSFLLTDANQQIKKGGLWLNSEGVADSKGLIVENGNVGIGVINPQHELDISGEIRINGSAVQAPDVYMSGNGFISAADNLYLGVDQNDNATGSLIIKKGASTIAGESLMVLDNDGHMGLGDIIWNNPDYFLNISASSTFSNAGGLNLIGDVAVAPDIHFNLQGLLAADDSIRLNVDGDNDGSGNLIVAAGAATSSARTLLTVMPNGNTGIGTATPASKLNLYDAANGPIMNISGRDVTYRGLSIRNRSSNLEHWFYGANSDNDFVIRRGDLSDALMIDRNSGFVGIGTSSPIGILDVDIPVVKGGLVIAGGNIGTAAVPAFNFTPLRNSGKLLVGWNRQSGMGEVDLIANRGGAATDLNNGGFNFYDYKNDGVAPDFLMRINGHGDVGIGTGNPNGKLDVAGAGGLIVAAGVAMNSFDFGPFSNSGQLAQGWNFSSGRGEIDFVSNRRGAAAAAGNGGFDFYDYPNGGPAPIHLMTINGGGNVGIGLQNPQYRLDVTSAAPNLTDIHFGSNGVLSSDAHMFLNIDADNTGVGNLYIGTDSYTTTHTNLVTVLNNGRVGIGSTSPNYKLDVNGVINAMGVLINGVPVGGGGGSDYVNNAANATLTRAGAGPYTLGLNLGNANTWTAAQTYNASTNFPGSGVWNSSGNLGVGINAPWTKLHVYDALSGPILSMSGLATNYRGVSIKDTLNTEQWFSGSDFSNNFVIRNSGVNSLNVNKANGNIGINTDIPAYKLEVNGDLGFTGGAPRAIQGPVGSNFIINGRGTNLILRYNGTNGFILNNAGDVGIGVGVPGYKLQVAGDIGATGFFYTSDRMLKKDIELIASPLDKVMGLEGVSFKWKEDNKPSIGFIAQDVEKVLPELVKTNEETGMKSVQYGNMTALTVEAIKELNKQIKALNERIENLESELSKYRK